MAGLGRTWRMGTTWTWRGSSPWSTRPCLARPTRGTRSCLRAVPGGTTPGRAGPASGTGSRRAASAVVSAVTVTCARGASSGSVGGSGRPRSVPFSLGALQCVTGARGRPYPVAARTAAFPPRWSCRYVLVGFRWLRRARHWRLPALCVVLEGRGLPERRGVPTMPSLFRGGAPAAVEEEAH